MKPSSRIAAAVCLVLLAAGAFPALAEDRSAVISLASGVIDVHQAAPIPKGLDVAAAEAGAEDYVLVKFPGPVTAAQLAALERASERVYTYLPHDAFLVKAGPALRDKLAGGELGASWSGPYHPVYKLSPAVAALSADKAAVETPRQVLLHVFPDADLDAVLGKLAALSAGEVVASRQKERFSRIRLMLNDGEIAKLRGHLARFKEVFYVDLEARRVLLNDTTVWVAQSGTAGGQQTPVHDRGILGQGQIVGILDTGIDADMCYFRDPGLGLPPVNACDGGTVVDANQRKVIAVDFLWSNECSGGITAFEWDTHDHGSHVAGTVAGDDFANLLAHDPGDGLAPGAKLVIQDCGFQTNNCADCPGIGCPVVDLNPIFQQPYDQGARIHTNSWGDDENNPNGGLYSAGSEDADQFMWNHKDFLLLFAAGNSGPGSQTVLSPATGKNVVAVGATLRGSSAESMASFSSCGPTADGRLKPDVTMPGSSIVSANADNNTGSFNCNTRTMSGTSMASPGAAGTAALVRQYYMDGWYPSGSATPADAFTPSAALIKATLINSGHDMTNVSAIPSLCQGWGRVLLDDALHFAGDARSLFVEDDAAGFAQGSTGEDRVFNLDVNAGEPFEVTLTWTDFPSTPAASPNIVNDLDLIVSGPGGTYLGNVFSGGESTTGGSADRLDSVEQVLLANPTAGSYTVTVRSFTVPSGPQPFALVATGDLGTAGCTSDPECDDGVSCTVDSCNQSTSTCDNVPDDGACDNGLFCDGVETCDPALDCQPGVDPCAGGACDEAGDVCTSVCGDGTCDPGEDCNSCAADCPSFPLPGYSCGNGLCEAGDGEDCVSCPADCNGVQGGKPANRFCCGFGGTNPVGCADSRCVTGGFACTETPQGPGGSTCCGDSLCESPEDSSSCALDCGPPPVCGDMTCDPGEDECSCAADCGAPPADEVGLCADGADNDCDGFTDCDDSDCDPVCQVDCSTFTDKPSCNAQPTCRWDNKNKVCVPS